MQNKTKTRQRRRAIDGQYKWQGIQSNQKGYSAFGRSLSKFVKNQRVIIGKSPQFPAKVRLTQKSKQQKPKNAAQEDDQLDKMQLSLRKKVKQQSYTNEVMLIKYAQLSHNDFNQEFKTPVIGTNEPADSLFDKTLVGDEKIVKDEPQQQINELVFKPDDLPVMAVPIIKNVQVGTQNSGLLVTCNMEIIPYQLYDGSTSMVVSMIDKQKVSHPIIVQGKVQFSRQKIPQVIQKIVNKQIIVQKQKLISFPRSRAVQVRVQVPRYIQKFIPTYHQRIVQKRVQVPVQTVITQYVEVPIQKVVTQYVDRIVEVPRDVERLVEVPIQKVVTEYVDRIVQVPIQKIVIQQVEKLVEKPVYVDRQRIVQSPPEVKYIQVIKQIIKQVPREQMDLQPVTITVQVPVPVQVPIYQTIQTVKQIFVDRQVYIPQIVEVEKIVYKTQQIIVQKQVIVQRQVPIEKIIYKQVIKKQYISIPSQPIVKEVIKYQNIQVYKWKVVNQYQYSLNQVYIPVFIDRPVVIEKQILVQVSKVTRTLINSSINKTISYMIQPNMSLLPVDVALNTVIKMFKIQPQQQMMISLFINNKNIQIGHQKLLQSALSIPYQFVQRLIKILFHRFNVTISFQRFQQIIERYAIQKYYSLPFEELERILEQISSNIGQDQQIYVPDLVQTYSNRSVHSSASKQNSQTAQYMIPPTSALSYGQFAVTINYKQGKYWIGLRNRTGSYYTKNMVILRQKGVYNLIKLGKRQLLIPPTPQKYVQEVQHGKCVFIRDLYKGKYYYGLRMIGYYNNQVYFTRNGFNLLRQQFNMLIDHLFKSFSPCSLSNPSVFIYFWGRSLWAIVLLVFIIFIFIHNRLIPLSVQKLSHDLCLRQRWRYIRLSKA